MKIIVGFLVFFASCSAPKVITRTEYVVNPCLTEAPPVASEHQMMCNVVGENDHATALICETKSLYDFGGYLDKSTTWMESAWSACNKPRGK